MDRRAVTHSRTNRNKQAPVKWDPKSESFWLADEGSKRKKEKI